MNNEKNIIQKMLGWLISQFEDALNLKKFFRAVAPEIQALEDAFWALFTERLIENAQGETLDMWGKVVGQKREGRDDPEFRALIRVRILRNTSGGTPNQLMAILKGLTEADKVAITELAAVAIFEFVGADPPAQILESLRGALQEAAPAGVRILGAVQTDGNAFRFDTAGAGFDEGELSRLA